MSSMLIIIFGYQVETNFTKYVVTHFFIQFSLQLGSQSLNDSLSINNIEILVTP